MSGVIRWEDPPPRKRQGWRQPARDWLRIAAQLRDRPKEWAVVGEGLAPSYALFIREGTKMPAFKPPGSFDATSRVVNGVSVIYARYVGGES